MNKTIDKLSNENEALTTNTETGKSTNLTYGQYCGHRLPCGICSRTNSMCPLAGSESYPSIIPTCNPPLTPINPITNPPAWYSNELNSVHSTPDPTISAYNKTQE